MSDPGLFTLHRRIAIADMPLIAGCPPALKKDQTATIVDDIPSPMSAGSHEIAGLYRSKPGSKPA